MTNDETRALVAAITYKPGWSFRVVDEGSGRLFVQAEVSTVSDLTMDPTGKTSARTPWRSGKRYLSPHMCRQEVVGTVLDLIKAAEMHEVHEWFRYRGASIYNPHLDPDALVAVARKASSFNVRADAMSMAEPVDETVSSPAGRAMAAATIVGFDPAEPGADRTTTWAGRVREADRAEGLQAADWSRLVACESAGTSRTCAFPHCDCGRD